MATALGQVTLSCGSPAPSTTAASQADLTDYYYPDYPSPTLDTRDTTLDTRPATSSSPAASLEPSSQTPFDLTLLDWDSLWTQDDVFRPTQDYDRMANTGGGLNGRSIHDYDRQANTGGGLNGRSCE